MYSIGTDRILRIGDTFLQGKIIKIEDEDGGWILTLEYCEGMHRHHHTIWVWHTD